MSKPVQEVSKEERIIAAAEEVFSRKGYTKATLDEIIKIADTGKGTVYKYYKNKDFLFYTLIEGKHKKLLATLAEQCRKDFPFEQRFKGYMMGLLEFVQANQVLWQVLLFEATASSEGWCLRWDENKKDYDVVVNWGEEPTKEAVEILRKYYEILRAEVGVLEEILNTAVEKKEIKEMKKVNLVAANIFFGAVVMLCQQPLEDSIESIVDSMVDRFMNGHKC